MSKIATYKCNYCPTLKQESNHWWLVGEFSVQTHEGRVAFFGLRPWDGSTAQLPDIEHICSESCAHKALAKYMERKTNESSRSSQTQTEGQAGTQGEVPTETRPETSSSSSPGA